MSIKNPITQDKFDAVLFDLDGVITDSAKIHAACWKFTFDTFLKRHAEETGEKFVPFDTDTDYLLYVDGKPRYDGVRDFLNSRNIKLQEGTPDSPAHEQTVCGVGNRKNELVNMALLNKSVDVYQSSVDFVEKLIAGGIKTAVVSSSQNCETVLDSAGLIDLFPVRVDGKTAMEKKLKGKPSPDTFLEAAKILGVDPARSVVVEDAISGVQAGKNGNFGLVIGIARKQNAEELLENGADIAVSDLSEFID